MSKLRVELNRAGVRELMRSPEMRAIVEQHARAEQKKRQAGTMTYILHRHVQLPWCSLPPQRPKLTT